MTHKDIEYEEGPAKTVGQSARSVVGHVLPISPKISIEVRLIDNKETHKDKADTEEHENLGYDDVLVKEVDLGIATSFVCHLNLSVGKDVYVEDARENSKAVSLEFAVRLDDNLVVKFVVFNSVYVRCEPVHVCYNQNGYCSCYDSKPASNYASCSGLFEDQEENWKDQVQLEVYCNSPAPLHTTSSAVLLRRDEVTN